MTVTLTPVLELEPSIFKNPDRAYPLSYSTEISEKFWRDCLKDSGIIDLKPYEPASWFVRLSDVTKSTYLETIISKHLEDTERELLEEIDFLALIGGYAFEYRDIIILPTCCCDLGNISEWEAAANCKNKESGDIWIGHPWLTYRSQDDVIEITQTTEYEESPQPEIFEIPQKELVIAVAKAKEELQQLEKDIIPIAKKILPDKYTHFAHQLVWGDFIY